MGQHYYILQLFRIFGRDIASQLFALLRLTLSTTPLRNDSIVFGHNKTKKKSQAFPLAKASLRPTFSQSNRVVREKQRKAANRKKDSGPAHQYASFRHPFVLVVRQTPAVLFRPFGGLHSIAL